MSHTTLEAHPGETLDALLSLQAAQLKQMLALLEQERSLLVGQDHKALADMADSKAALAYRLSSVDAQLASHPQRQEPEAVDKLRAIKPLAEQCHEANAVNGEIIVQLQKRQSQQSELLLRALGQSNRTYNQRGEAASRTRLLGDIQA